MGRVEVSRCVEGRARRPTFSMCLSSPREKLRSSSEFFSNTVPFVSVCAMSMPHVKTPTLAFAALWTVPAAQSQLLALRLASQGRTLRLATKHHSANDPARAQSSTHDLDHPHVVDVELGAEISARFAKPASSRN